MRVEPGDGLARPATVVLRGLSRLQASPKGKGLSEVRGASPALRGGVVRVVFRKVWEYSDWVVRTTGQTFVDSLRPQLGFVSLGTGWTVWA
jgi:hypothetical protein